MKKLFSNSRKKNIFFYWIFNPITRALSALEAGTLFWKSNSRNSETWMWRFLGAALNFMTYRNKNGKIGTGNLSPSFNWIHYSVTHSQSPSPANNPAHSTSFLTKIGLVVTNGFLCKVLDIAQFRWRSAGESLLYLTVWGDLTPPVLPWFLLKCEYVGNSDCSGIRINDMGAGAVV